MDPISLPLSHIKILDLGRIMAGPWATQLLADLGATIWKIEHPFHGDDTRKWGPPFTDSNGQNQQSAYFLSANRGKESIGIDFSQAGGRELILNLAKKCDVFVENFMVGTLAKHGLSYEDIKKVNPRIIYCSITGFGQEGPCKDVPGYDFMIQAMSGLMSITGLPDEEEGAGPMKVGLPIVDMMTGMYATVAIQAALMGREKSGEGKWIDLNLYDVAVAMLANQGMNYLVGGKVPGRIGNAHPNIVPYQVVNASDGPFVLAVGNDGQFKRFCELLDKEGEEIAADPRFSTNQQRVLNRKELVPRLQKLIKLKKCEWWLKKLQEKNIPSGPIRNIQESLEGAGEITRPLISGVGPSIMIKNPIRFVERSEPAPPQLGEHTDKILTQELNLPKEKMEELRKQKVIN